MTTEPLRRLFAALPAALLAAGLAYPAAAADLDCAPGRITLLAASGPQTFEVELALTPAEQQKGLMFRESMADGAGMLFVFDQPHETRFWMRNTLIPLDMLFIDDTGRVANIAVREDTQSDADSGSAGPVRAVLEINAGLSAKLGIAPGTQAINPAFAEAPEGARCPG